MDVKIIGITFHLEVPEIDEIQGSLQRIEENQEKILKLLGEEPQINFIIGPVTEQED